jgi:TatD family-associated radical SAM protein
VQQYDLTLGHRPEIQEIIHAVGDPVRYREVVFCGYGEPTLRLATVLTVTRHVKARQGRVRINTDGLANLVHKKNVLPRMAGCVDALSVSMNAQDAKTYERHCRPALPGSYQAMLDFLAEAPGYVPEVVATAIDGLEGVDIDACAAIAERLGVSFRRRVLDQVG